MTNPKTPSDAPHKPKPADRQAATDEAAKELIQGERDATRAKTERLRKQRLQRLWGGHTRQPK